MAGARGSPSGAPWQTKNLPLSGSCEGCHQKCRIYLEHAGFTARQEAQRQEGVVEERERRGAARQTPRPNRGAQLPKDRGPATGRARECAGGRELRGGAAAVTSESLAGRLGASGAEALLHFERPHGQSCVTGESQNAVRRPPEARPWPRPSEVWGKQHGRIGTRSDGSNVPFSNVRGIVIRPTGLTHFVGGVFWGLWMDFVSPVSGVARIAAASRATST